MDPTNRSFHKNRKPNTLQPQKYIYRIGRLISCPPPPRRAECPQIGCWGNRRKITCSVRLAANDFNLQRSHLINESQYIWALHILPLKIVYLSRMVRLCKVDDNNKHDNMNSCYCAASLITSKHALTAFHCVDGDMESETYTEKSCELRDLSKRENHFCF